MLTPRQRAWYWREWAAACKAAKAAGLETPDRHALHRRALGHDKSSLDLTNEDLDKVISEFRSYSAPDCLQPQLLQLHQPRTRMLHLIRHTKLRELAVALTPPGFPPHTPDPALLARAQQYIATIVREKYHSADLDDLTNAQLTLLIVDITRATNARRRTLGLSWPALRSAAGTSSHPHTPAKRGQCQVSSSGPDSADCPF